MTKLKLINKISKASIMGLSIKRKFQLLTWSNSRLERVLKAIKQQQNKQSKCFRSDHEKKISTSYMVKC